MENGDISCKPNAFILQTPRAKPNGQLPARPREDRTRTMSNEELLKRTLRKSGVVLHPTSLPGPHGMGSLGRHAREFVDFLARAEQKVWQVLPLGPTGLGNSPYMCTSAFAGNPLLIDLETLVDDGLLDADAVVGGPDRRDHIDFALTIAFKEERLAWACARFRAHASDDDRAAFAAFKQEHSDWLDDFCLFTALSRAQQFAPWNRWPKPLKTRQPEALQAARQEHAEAIDTIAVEQFLFRRQWMALLDFAHQNQVMLVGDVPIVVAANSADVWANPDIYWLDDDGEQIYEAGVPPDYFSPTGQLWGNPIYRWDVLAHRGYDWWIQRFKRTLETVDLIRIDHFRGFADYWQVEAGQPNAINGKWVPGPGRDLFDAVHQALGQIPVIAEDLGIITPRVEELRDALELPGMKVLQFAFGGDSANPHLPHCHIPRCVVYPGTHDNDTTVGWYAGADAEVLDHVRSYLRIDGNDIAWQFIGVAWQSPAELAVVVCQDLLSLDSSARMNTPGVADGNWSWRLLEGQLHDGIAERLRGLTRLYWRSERSYQRK